MADPKEVEIDGVQVFIRKYDPFLSVAVLGDLQRHLLGPAGAIFSMQDKKPGVDLSEYSVERMVEKLSSGLDGETLLRLVRRIVNPDYISIQFGEMDKPVKATEGNINLAFTEDPFGGLTLLCKEVLMLNYSAFFMRAASLFGLEKEAGEAK